MSRRPTWGVSAWSGFICALFALSSLMSGGEIEITGVMLGGALLLFAWAAWLAHGDH
jgi:hypothetical protein